MYGCDATEHPFKDAVQKKELLLYCGITMLQPIMELAEIVENEKNTRGDDNVWRIGRLKHVSNIDIIIS